MAQNYRCNVLYKIWAKKNFSHAIIFWGQKNLFWAYFGVYWLSKSPIPRREFELQFSYCIRMHYYINKIDAKYLNPSSYGFVAYQI